ncbi:MAG: hypothetical protein JWP89_2712 [Schlesneria sp.]|nr:hypothetical protein [Schlesneria sp.]
MDTIEGTDIEQANLPTSAENSVGSAFAILNPPMSSLPAGVIPGTIPPSGTLLSVEQWKLVMQLQIAKVPKQADVPKPWHPAAEQIPAPDMSHPRYAPTCGLVTITNEVWVPKSPRAVPPSVTNRLGMALSAQFAMFYNNSHDAHRHHRWALVTSRGPVIILCGINPETRPSDPADFPPCVLGGLISEVAEQLMIEANAPRCQFARVPKEWTIVVRRADRVGQDGGA